ncbi:LysM peptidoglycan-binding domain-containing protein [Limosilactobacillus sp.]|uniref:aggregation-promoting factor n=1 Tax=Limosilactobacillus sp. TaxID=2773925 RepID=UPI0035A1BED9
MKLSKKAAKITAAIAGAVALGTIATATTANADSIYTVQAGDTLSGISYKLGHDLTFVDTLANNNNIANKDVIYVGQKLVIKDDGEVAPATAHQVATLPAATSQNTATKTQSTNNAGAQTTSTVSGSEAAAKAWIASHESGGSYSAANGQYIGKYQLSASYLNGDYSAANQERVADQYVASRYGSWTAAQSFWQSHGWY